LNLEAKSTKGFLFSKLLMGIIEILGCEIILFYIRNGGRRAYHHGKVQKKTNPTE